MKDLLIFTADADIGAFIKSILSRPRALGIRDVQFDTDRHPLRDSGMVQSGAELMRLKKGMYQKLLLLWDHHGSGRDHRNRPADVEGEIRSKLDDFTWAGHHAAVAIVPELEVWLWHCVPAMAAYWDVLPSDFERWTLERAARLGKSADWVRRHEPKELFEHIVRDRLKRTISPKDFALIAERASVRGLLECESFARIAEVLGVWFPAE